MIHDFLRNRLDIDHLYIARAHRLGQRNPNKRFQSRPIIANFRDYGTLELIMSNVRRLRGTNFSVDLDYPREIQEARSRMWSLYKEIKQNNPRFNVKIVYPAKLIHDGTVIRDELPEWGQYVGANRLSKLGQIDHVKNQYVRKPTDTVTSNDSITQNMSTQPHVENDISVFMQPRPVHIYHSVPVTTQLPVAKSIHSEIISPATCVPPPISNQATIPSSSSVGPVLSQDICKTNTTPHLDNQSTSSVGTPAMGIATATTFSDKSLLCAIKATRFYQRSRLPEGAHVQGKQQPDQ